METVDGIGAQMNAGTSKEWTNYYLRGRVEILPKLFEILSEVVLKPRLRSTDMEREKGVILQEIKRTKYKRGGPGNGYDSSGAINCPAEEKP